MKKEPGYYRGHHPPPMSAICGNCGLRYGTHMVHTLTCPNPDWRCGNGQPQWLKNQVFAEAGREPEPRR